MSLCLHASPLISLRAATKQVERILKEHLVIGFSGGLQLIADDYDETVAQVNTLARRIDDAIHDGVEVVDPDAARYEEIRREIAEGWIHDGDSLRRVASAEIEAREEASAWHSFTVPPGDACPELAEHARNCTSLDGGAA